MRYVRDRKREVERVNVDDERERKREIRPREQGARLTESH